jgi:hypothetical protein
MIVQQLLYMQKQLLSENRQADNQPGHNTARHSEAEMDTLLAQTRAELEQKTRALEIEAALERVRARALNMHHSFELSEVLSVLFEQYDILGIRPYAL